MSKSPFFTILTASLNSQSTLKKTLDSIKNQTFQNFEHVVIDGGSNDGTIDILNRIENSYNMSWSSEPDQGIADALNKGLRLAKGDYVLVLHADDCLLSPDTLEYVFKIIKNQKYDIYSFPVLKEYSDRRPFLYKPIRILWWHHFKTIFPHQGSFVHQRTYRVVGEYRKQLSIAMDYDFFYRALQSECSVKFEKQPVARMGGKGISSSAAALTRRLREERKVQILNEKNRMWRLAQFFFWMLYLPYKTQMASSFKRSS
jgi:glycosyltransferase involved in cell wall biosynthesis